MVNPHELDSLGPWWPVCLSPGDFSIWQKPRPRADAPAAPLHSLADSLLGTAKDRATSEKGYLLGDHAQHTWGITIPCLIFQYVIGGSNILPAQRFVATSGAPKSMKSTLQIEILTWYAYNQGFGRYIDAEEKSSASMFEAMTWWKFLSPEDPYTDAEGNFCFYPESVERDSEGWPVDMNHPDRVILIPVNPDPEVQQGGKRLIYTKCSSIDEWQDRFTETVKWAQAMVADNPDRKALGARVPIHAVIDSVTGADYIGNTEDILKEGHAQERSFSGAARANKIGSYLRAMSLRGTCMSAGLVRHLTTNIGDGSFASKFEDKEKEAGGSLSNFQSSVSLRLKKGGKIDAAGHPARSKAHLSRSVTIKTNFSCLGPDVDKVVTVDVIWQHVEMPNGETRQIMTYDWHGALGRYLWAKKYEKSKKDFAYGIERLNKAVYFVKGKTNHVKCEALQTEEELEAKKELNFTEFGRRIEAHPEIRKAVARYLNITQYPDVQGADIDWTTPGGE